MAEEYFKVILISFNDSCQVNSANRRDIPFSRPEPPFIKSGIFNYVDI